MKWIWKVVFGIFAAAQAKAQIFHSPEKSVYLTGNAYSGQFTDAFSFTGNPAVLGSAKSLGLAVSGERKWMLKELAYNQLACSFPAGGGGLGLHFHHSGDAGYNESSLAIGYGKDLGKISLGLQFGYDTYDAAGYGNKTGGSVRLGLRFHPVEKVYAGMVLSSSLLGKIEKTGPERGPGNYSMGFGYELSSGVFISAQFVKETGIPGNAIVCVDYHWNDQFFAAMGVEMNAVSPFAKAGWGKNRLKVELYTNYHPARGFTPGLVLLWEGKKRPG